MRRLLGAIAACSGAAVLLIVGSPATAAVPAGLSYVALGDSYSAGFGLEPFSATSPFTATPATDLNGCYQAEANYPHLTAASLGFELHDETCSGAVTANLTTTPQLTMTGQTAPSVQAAALSASTDIVTISIGGNDLGFATVARNCIRIDVSLAPVALLDLTPAVASCEAYYTADTGTWTGQVNIDDLLADTVVPALDATFDAIATAAPNAKVFVVGYPKIAPSDASIAGGCFTQPLPPDTDTVPFGPSDLVWLSDVEASLDAAIATAAGERGANWMYVSNWAGSADHTLCDPEPWITAITLRYPNPSDPCNPLLEETLSYDSFSVCLTLGALHPNAAGVAFLHAQVVTAITAAHPDLEATPPDPVPVAQLANGGSSTPTTALAVGGLALLAIGSALLARRARTRSTTRSTTR
jgi:lysophospholipase L1-like esterase